MEIITLPGEQTETTEATSGVYRLVSCEPGQGDGLPEATKNVMGVLSATGLSEAITVAKEMLRKTKQVEVVAKNS